MTGTGKNWLALVALAGMAAGASAAYVTDYEFNDPVDTPLPELANGGSDQNGFSWNNTAAKVNGNGDLVVTDGIYLGHDPYDNPVTNGVVTYELAISSWDLTAYAAANPNKEPAMFQVGAAGGTHLDRIRLGLKIDANSNVVIRSDGAYLEKDIGLPLASTNGIRFRQVVDLNNNTYSISYQRYSDAPYWTGWSHGDWGTRGGILGIAMMQGDGTWAPGDFIAFDSLKVETAAKLDYKGEDWEMNEPDGTMLSGLRNLTGDAGWSGDTSDVFTTNGALRFTAGNTDQAYRHCTVPAQSNGVFELKTRYTAANLTGESDTVGFGMHDSSTGKNIYMLRLQKSSEGLILQYVIGNFTKYDTITLLNGNGTELTNALVARAVADFDAQEVTFYYDYGEGEKSVGPIGFEIANPTFDIIRMAANNSSDIWSTNNFVDVDYLILTPILPPDTPESFYSAWVNKYPGMGSQTNFADNPDGDMLNNLYEYALGGNPEVADTGNASTFRTLEADGGKFLEYVYAKRADAEDRGLDYYLETSPDLIHPSWTNDNYTVLGSGTLDDEFNTVTNQVPTAEEAKQFIRLMIEFNP